MSNKRDAFQKLLRQIGRMSLSLASYPKPYPLKEIPRMKGAFLDCVSTSPLSILSSMSIRNRGGEWESLLLGIQPEHCGVCNRSLYRHLTMLKGGWARCSICERFVHYSCLASGKFLCFKRRPRVCQSCNAPTQPNGSPVVSPLGSTEATSEATS